jgi:DNA-binding transcriptional LysR family regulator
MKTEYLEEFASLATALNFTKVAREFHLSTSVLSKHIMSLEKELGVKLFTRNTTSVLLTPVGKRFFENLLPLLEHYHSVIKDIKSSPEYTQRQLKIILVARSNLLAKAAISVATAFTKERNIHISYSMPTHSDYIDSLKKSDADALITYISTKIPKETVIIPLYRDPFVAVVSNDHPLAKKKKISLVNDLNEHRILRLVGTFFRPGYNTMEDAFERFGVKPHARYLTMSSLDDLSLLSDFPEVFITPSDAVQQLLYVSPETHTVLGFEEDLYFESAVVYLPEKYSDALDSFTKELFQRLNPL